MQGRDIVLIIDGTDCSAARGAEVAFTNAFMISVAVNAFAEDDTKSSPVILYQPGPGNRKVAGRLANSITGAEMESMVREAYLALCINVTDIKNDRIHIFGYSRGAVVVKALVEMLFTSELLDKDHLYLINHAYTYYMHRKEANKAFLVGKTRRVNVEFVGLFDPVSGPKTKAQNIRVDKMIRPIVKYAVELISIDEKRISFRPLLWRLARRPENIQDQKLVKLDTSADHTQLHQIWLPGSHGDIADQSGNSVLTDIAFLTMIERVSAKTKLPINYKLLNEVFDRVVVGRNGLKITDRSFFIWRKRSIPKGANCQLHVVYRTMAGKKIKYNDNIESRIYNSDMVNSAANFMEEYPFNLKYIVKGNGDNPEDMIIGNITKMQSQI